MFFVEKNPVNLKNLAENRGSDKFTELKTQNHVPLVTNEGERDYS